MKLVGIDGGGTKTAAVLFDGEGRVLARHAAGPCNPNVQGFDESTLCVKEIVETLTQGEPRCVTAIYIGTAGIFTKDNGPRFADAVSRTCGVESVKCENDVMNVIAAATDSERCVAGVSGTGMIVHAKEPDRVTRLVVPSCPQVVGACVNCARFCGLDSQAVRERLVRDCLLNAGRRQGL